VGQCSVLSLPVEDWQYSQAPGPAGVTPGRSGALKVGQSSISALPVEVRQYNLKNGSKDGATGVSD
jgi:hypothetical protein